jgi:hypothetical protein
MKPSRFQRERENQIEKVVLKGHLHNFSQWLQEQRFEGQEREAWFDLGRRRHTSGSSELPDKPSEVLRGRAPEKGQRPQNEATQIQARLAQGAEFPLSFSRCSMTSSRDKQVLL